MTGWFRSLPCPPWEASHTPWGPQEGGLYSGNASAATLSPAFLVSCGCCGKSPQSIWLRTTEMCYFTVPEPEPKVTVSTGLAVPGGSEGEAVPCFCAISGGCWPSLTFLGLWVCPSNLCLLLQVALCPACLWAFPRSYKDPSHWI